VDIDFLKLAFNTLVMYYTDTKADYPNHSVNKKLESYVAAETLLEWSTTLRNEFVRLNAAGLPMSVLFTGGEFDISNKTLINHLKDQNKALLAMNQTVTTELHSMKCELSRLKGQMEEQSAHLEEQSVQFESLKDLIIANQAHMLASQSTLVSLLKKRARVSFLILNNVLYLYNT
jgi:hypothetical protein